MAGDFTLGDGIQGKFNGSASYGTSMRTEEPDPGLLGNSSVKRVYPTVTGRSPGAIAGGSDLNFPNNAAVSTVLKAMADVELKQGDYGVFARAKAWQDFALTDDNHPYGNFANRFVPGKLSDSGFDPEAKFSNAQMVDYYAFGKFDVGAGAPMDVKLGRQFLNWGAAKMVGGGVNVINPVNTPGATRPGALAEESRLPVGMLSANLQNSKQWGAEAFAQYEARSNVYPGCGTYLQTTNFVPTGCNAVFAYPALSEQTALTQGIYAHRSADVNASDSGQFGLSLRVSPEGMDTDFRFYAMNLHSRLPSIRITNPNIAGGFGTFAPAPAAAPAPATVTRLTDPNGIKYGLVFAENIQVTGVSFESKLAPGTMAFGELVYRPNQILNLNASDLIAAFLQRSPNSALNKAKNITALPAGATFDAYDRYAITNLSLGGTQVFPNLLGAERVVITAELGMSMIDGLPGADRVRYGRGDEYGGASYTGIANAAGVPTPCVASALQCNQDGFVTSSAWGYRLRTSATYAAGMATTVTPSLYFAHDVQGYSFDGTYSEGRRILRPGLRFDWDKKYFAEAQFNMNMGGLYNNLSDRDTFTVFAGMTF
jgi:hypothetical protein